MPAGDEEDRPDQSLRIASDASADGEPPSSSSQSTVHRKPPRRVYSAVLLVSAVLIVAGIFSGSWQAFVCGIGLSIMTGIAIGNPEGAGFGVVSTLVVLFTLLVGLVISGAVWDHQTDSTAARDEFTAWCPVSCTPGSAGNQTATLCRQVLGGDMSCSDLAAFNCNNSFTVFLRCRELRYEAQGEERHTNAHTAFIVISNLMAICTAIFGVLVFLLSLEGEARLWHWLAGRLPFTTSCVRCLGVEVSSV